MNLFSGNWQDRCLLGTDEHAQNGQTALGKCCLLQSLPAPIDYAAPQGAAPKDETQGGMGVRHPIISKILQVLGG